MGEMSYILNNGTSVRFSEDNYDYGCLCTFPFNYKDKKLSNGTVASLALLGAAVAIGANSPKSLITDYSSNGRHYLPYCIPEWIKAEINRILEIKKIEPLLCEKCNTEMEYDDFTQDEKGNEIEIWVCPKCSRSINVVESI
jgi:hypothetical protein